MGLKNVQKVLAKLYTNRTIRENFFIHPEKVGLELGLAKEDILKITSIPKLQIQNFAESLQRKRLGAVKKLLPYTSQAMCNFNTLFLNYSDVYTLEETKKHLWDAIQFAKYINKKEKMEPWLEELLSYELSWLKMQIPNKKIIINYFNYRVDLIDENNKQAIKQKMIFIWFRLFSSKIKYFRLPI